MKVQLHTAGVVAITLLCGVARALPHQTRQDTLMPCVQQCVDTITASGACDDSSDQTQCVCQSPTLQSCVQSNCPPSFVDPTAEYCGQGPFASGSSSQIMYTIQTDTEAYLTKSRTTGASGAATTPGPTIVTFNPSSLGSPVPTASATTSGAAAASSAATTSAAPASSGNAAAPKADLPSPWKGLLAAGLGIMMAVAVA